MRMKGRLVRTLVAVTATIQMAVSISPASAQSKDAKQPTGSISGVVTIDGKAAADVGVMLFRIVTGDAEAPAIARKRSDRDGKFLFEGLYPGEYGIEAYSPGRLVFDQTDEEGAVAIAVAEGASVKDVAIALELGGAITGRLVDDNGNPITSQSVDVYAITPSGKSSVWRSAAESDDRGVYWVFGLPPGAYVVGAGRETSLDAIDIDLTVHYDRSFNGGSTTLEGARHVEVARGEETQGVDIVLVQLVLAARR